MDAKEARALVERCLPRFAEAGLPPLDASQINDVKAKCIASLWAGMGNVYSIAISSSLGTPISIVAKRVELPSVCDSIGDQRKKDSYDVEANFYARGQENSPIPKVNGKKRTKEEQASPRVPGMVEARNTTTRCWRPLRAEGAPPAV